MQHHPIIDRPSIPDGPFAPAALAKTALCHLREHAESLAARGHPPDEIAAALTREAELWRARGADLPSDIIGTIIGGGISPDAALLAEQVQRVYVLAGWLYAHAATEIAALIVDAAQALLLDIDGTEDVPC